MSKNNRGTVRPAVSSPVAAEDRPSGTTALGAPGYSRDLQSELFLLAACSLSGEKAFHEGTDARVRRFRDLVRDAACAEPAWTGALLGWLRGPGGMRLAPVEAAAEYAWARQGEKELPPGPTVRQVTGSVLKRADEPGEIIAYWLSHYGRKMPIGFKRGIADAVNRLYTERALLKYDTREAAVRFGDVIEMVQPRYVGTEYGTWRDALYRFAIERRHGRDNGIPESLAMIRANADLRRRASDDPSALLDTNALEVAGMTWEDTLSLAGGRVDRGALWSALIPLLGYDALRMNLRNFDDAGVPDDIAERVAARLADPEQVAASKAFPFRFLSAYRAVSSLRWAYALEKALNASLSNVPALKGRTLVLVDRSPSMWDQKFSEHSDMPWADAAALFGAAIALRAGHADLVEFWASSAVVQARAGESVLKLVERFSFKPHPGGTDIPSAVKRHLRPDHARVVIITDEQTQAGYLPSNMHMGHGGMPPTLIDDLVPKSTPLYMWNFGGYKQGAAPSGSGNRHTLGGLTDNAFKLIPLLETGRDARWGDLFGSAVLSGKDDKRAQRYFPSHPREKRDIPPRPPNPGHAAAGQRAPEPLLSGARALARIIRADAPRRLNDLMRLVPGDLRPLPGHELHARLACVPLLPGEVELLENVVRDLKERVVRRRLGEHGFRVERFPVMPDDRGPVPVTGGVAHRGVRLGHLHRRGRGDLLRSGRGEGGRGRGRVLCAGHRLRVGLTGLRVTGHGRARNPRAARRRLRERCGAGARLRRPSGLLAVTAVRLPAVA